LRSMAVLKEICKLMREVCPDALLIQYANPMAMNCWYTAGEGVNTIGLCHSVQGTSAMLAEKIMGWAPGSYSYLCAGINHQAWFLEFKHQGKSALEEMTDRINEYTAGTVEAENDSDDLYGGGHEQVRAAIMKLTGYFQTESSHHASEYLPYFRKSPEQVARWVPERWDYYEICSNHDFEEQSRHVEELAEKPLEPSHEYGAYIIDSVVTDTPRVVYGNVRNTGLITNLPKNCCVEVPCLVNQQGVQPTYIGDLPVACVGVNMGSVAVQGCAVEGSRQGDRNLIHAAVALDKLTSAILDLPTCRAMVDELFEAEKQWLPQFA
jgi:alpha-galactosidase